MRALDPDEVADRLRLKDQPRIIARVMRQMGGFYLGQHRPENLRVSEEDFDKWLRNQGSKKQKSSRSDSSVMGELSGSEQTPSPRSDAPRVAGPSKPRKPSTRVAKLPAVYPFTQPRTRKVS